MGRRQVELAGVELGEVGEQGGGGGAVLDDQCGEIVLESGIAQVRERVGMHGVTPRGRSRERILHSMTFRDAPRAAESVPSQAR